MKVFDVPASVSAFINGQPVSADSSTKILKCISPIDESELLSVYESDANEVDAAVRAARHAFDAGPWPRMSVDERKRILLQIRDKIAANAEELAYLESVNVGLPIRNVSAVHIPRSARNFEFFAEVASQSAGQVYTQTQPYISYVTREPVGVGGLISPWNYPLGLGTMKIASCIAFGNTCVIKPSEYAPLTLSRFMELIHETDIPPGVINLVHGRGHVTGEALTSHPGVDVVSFTGGTATAKAIMKSAAAHLKPVAFELGGKSANIVTASANLERALDGSLSTIYLDNGQQCLAGSRILVERSIADEFIAKFIARAQNIRLGDPLSIKTELGPLCYEAHLEKVLSYVDIAAQDGAELLTGGKRSEAFAKGYFMEPTAVMAPDNNTRVCQEEIFGPFAAFLVFDDLDEAIAMANDSAFGLVGYLWSEHLPSAMQASREILAGTVWINTPTTRELRAPFGGYKDSGIGRDSAGDCLEFFTEAKTTTIATGDFPITEFGKRK